MDEYIDIVTNTGEPTGRTALKSEAHKKGLWHNTIHVWLYTKQGEILLQQRSHKKIIYPLLWDVSAAGHIDAGESFIKAAIREVYEELGLLLHPENLIKIGVFRHQSNYTKGSIKDYEFHHVYVSELKSNVKSLSLQEDEVEALKLVSFNELKSLLDTQNNNHFVKTNRDYYLFVIEELKKIL